MDSKTAAKILKIPEYASQLQIENAFTSQVKKINAIAQKNKDPVLAGSLRKMLFACMTAKKQLLPNVPIIDQDAQQYVTAIEDILGPMSENNKVTTGEDSTGGAQSGYDPYSMGHPPFMDQRPELAKSSISDLPIRQFTPRSKEPSDQEGVRENQAEKKQSTSDLKHRTKQEDKVNKADSSDSVQTTDAPQYVGFSVVDNIDASEFEAELMDSSNDPPPLRHYQLSEPDEKDDAFKKWFVLAKKGVDWLLVNPLLVKRVGAALMLVCAVFVIQSIVSHFNLQHSHNPYQTRRVPTLEVVQELLNNTLSKRETVIALQHQFKEKLNGKSAIENAEKEEVVFVKKEITRVLKMPIFDQNEAVAREATVNEAKQAFIEEDYHKSLYLLESIEAVTDQQLSVLLNVEALSLLRARLLDARGALLQVIKRSGWINSPISDELDGDLVQAEALLEDLRFEAAIAKYRPLLEKYKQLRKALLELIKLYTEIKLQFKVWDELPWKSEVDDSAENREIREMRSDLDKMIAAAKIPIALEHANVLYDRIIEAIKSRKWVTSARINAGKAADAYMASLKFNKEPLDEAEIAYNKGLFAFKGGGWSRAVAEFNRAEQLYRSKTLIEDSSSVTEHGVALKAKDWKLIEAEANYKIPVMVKIYGGSFAMGDLTGEGDPAETPVHSVTIDNFFISKYEITFTQYDSFAKETGRSFPKDEGWGRGSRPVVNVSWDDAAAYAQWLSNTTGDSYRLPTESEWEYASRAGTQSKFYWGNEPKLELANCRSCGSKANLNSTLPVGSLPPNPWGLYDMAGNVAEWVADCWNGDYKGAPQDGSPIKLMNCKRSIVRGGSWDDDWWLLRSAARYGSDRIELVNIRGFRVAK